MPAACPPAGYDAYSAAAYYGAGYDYYSSMAGTGTAHGSDADKPKGGAAGKAPAGPLVVQEVPLKPAGKGGEEPTQEQLMQMLKERVPGAADDGEGQETEEQKQARVDRRRGGSGAGGAPGMLPWLAIHVGELPAAQLTCSVDALWLCRSGGRRWCR